MARERQDGAQHLETREIDEDLSFRFPEMQIEQEEHRPIMEIAEPAESEQRRIANLAVMADERGGVGGKRQRRIGGMRRRQVPNCLLLAETRMGPLENVAEEEKVLLFAFRLDVAQLGEPVPDVEFPAALRRGEILEAADDRIIEAAEMIDPDARPDQLHDRPREGTVLGASDGEENVGRRFGVEVFRQAFAAQRLE